MKNATYVEAARWGKYRGWRYVLGLVIILFAWLVVGTGASVLVAIIGQPDYFVLDYLVLGPFGKFLFVMAGFPFFLAGVLIAVTLIHRRHPLTSTGSWLTVSSNYFLVPGLLWTVVSLIDGTTELAIGAHFANNIIGILLFNITGSAVTTSALFTISEYHATYVALSVLVAIPIFLAIAYKVFKRDGASEPVFQRHRKGR
jgi:hypothetical protein